MHRYCWRLLWHPCRPLEMQALCPRPLCHPRPPNMHSCSIEVLSTCLKVFQPRRCLLLDILVWQHSWTLTRQLFLSLLPWSDLSIPNGGVPHISTCPRRCTRARTGLSIVASSHGHIQLASCLAYDHGVTGEFRFL